MFPELVVPIEHFVKILRIQANVTGTPGTEFGPRFTREFRINFSQDHAAAVDAMQRTIKLIERYRR